jgi:3-hydroxybutyryl-CoA dehydrogenase
LTDQSTSTSSERSLGIAGSGAIALGLARLAAEHGLAVTVCARSDASAARAIERLPGDVAVGCDAESLGACGYVVEAIAEDLGAKSALLAAIDRIVGPETIIATTTSSLSVDALARASGRPDRFVGLHVFNPVKRMELIEVAFPPEASDTTRQRTYGLAARLHKTAVDVPDVPGFVVNRLLFPYLFSAVELMEETGMAPEDIDRCMTLGARHPLGPLALLDLVGLDVAAAIGETIGHPAPARVHALIAEGRLGLKTDGGFH